MAGLYIHIPFCAHKCSYCDFVSFVCNTDTQYKYVDLLTDELRIAAAEYSSIHIDTVFIGGGTPSILTQGEIERIMNTVFSLFNIAPEAEITIECNPGTLNAEKLCEYRESGINRLSIGLQSASDRLLELITRIHTKADFLRSLSQARAAGFQNINADIMYGLPTQSVAELADTLAFVCDCGLTHISAYSLITEEHTPLYNALQSGVITLPDEDIEYEMHKLVSSTLGNSGYKRYEISNYAKEGFECRHNLCYWNQDEYIGVGINSHSAVFSGKASLIRRSNYAALDEYEAHIKNGKLPIEQSTEVSDRDAMFEYVMLGLRKTAGFKLSEFKKRFSQDFMTVFGEKLERISVDLYVLNDSFYLTDKGLDLQNKILCELL